MAASPTRAVPSNDMEIGSGTFVGESDAFAWKPTSEPAPSVTFQIEVMEYGATRDVMISYWLFRNESCVIAGVSGPATSVGPLQLAHLIHRTGGHIYVAYR